MQAPAQEPWSWAGVIPPTLVQLYYLAHPHSTEYRQLANKSSLYITELLLVFCKYTDLKCAFLLVKTPQGLYPQGIDYSENKQAVSLKELC